MTEWVWLAMAFVAQPAFAQEHALARLPEVVDPRAQHVFYLHGKIIEDAGRRPTHPRWGVYEYDAVLTALAAAGNVVISEQRAPGTSVARYAASVKVQVEQLLAAGVPADRISVVGFSKGGAIAQAVSARLRASIRYVFIASCDGTAKGPLLHGHVLSLREKSDTTTGSCVPRLRASPELSGHREIEIAIGGGHGAFYRPHDAWMKPLLRFVAAQ
jgi:hypothetical protein